MNLLKILKNYSVKAIHVKNHNNDIPSINKFVKNVYVINLKEDLYKRNYVYLLMKKYGISFTFVVVDRVLKETHNLFCEKENLNITKSELGCCLSHLWCLNDIIKNKYENAIIFEDDIILHKDFTNKLLVILQEKNYDFLLLGAHDFQFSKKNYKRVENDKTYFPYEDSIHLYGAHANYYSLKGAIRMFHIRVSELSYFDKEYMLMFKHFKDTSGVCYPNLAVTNITTSALNHERTPLSFLETEYYQKCFINFDFTKYNFIYINMINKSMIKHHDNYQHFIETCLYHLFNDFDKTEKLKHRFVMNFFTLKDIIFIFSDKYKFKYISHQTVSPKNVSENNLG